MMPTCKTGYIIVPLKHILHEAACKTSYTIVPHKHIILDAVCKTSHKTVPLKETICMTASKTDRKLELQNGAVYTMLCNIGHEMEPLKDCFK